MSERAKSRVSACVAAIIVLVVGARVRSILQQFAYSVEDPSSYATSR
jgi:hypothetical protein